MEEIIKYWRELDFKSKPYLHPKDEASINPKNHYVDIKSYKDLIKHEDFGIIKNGLHLNLIPQPYTGDITNATIYILLLNPGFSILDYIVESKKEIREDIIKSTRQEFDANEDYPMMWLNPKYLWTDGGQWIESKLKWLIEYVIIEKKCTYVEALKHVSKKVAILELVPYHSKTFGLKKKELGLESAKMMRKFVSDFLVKKAIDDDKACIIQTRSIKEWGLNLDEHNNIIIYHKGQRSASLSKNPQAYLKIKEFIFK